MKSLVIVKHADFLIPEDYIKRATKHHDRALGLAFVDTSGTSPELVVDKTDVTEKRDLSKTILEAQEELKSSLVLFHLIGGSGKIVQDDVQPFEIVKNNAKEPLLIAFAAGNFDHHVSVGSERPGEFMIYGKYLLPIMNEMFVKADKNMENLLKEMGSSMFKMSMENLYRDSGTIVFLTNDGAMLSFGSNLNAREFEWGKVTGHFDYSESSNTTAKAVLNSTKDKVRSFLGKNPKGETSEVKEETKEHVQKVSDKDMKTAAEAKVEEKKEETQTGGGYRAFNEKVEQIESSAPSAESGERIEASPPATYKTSNNGRMDKNSLKQWYRFCSVKGNYPQGWKSFIPVECWKNRVEAWNNGIRSIKDFKDPAIITKTVVPSDAPKTSDTALAVVQTKTSDTAPKYVGKDTMSKHLAEPEKDVVDADGNLPLIPAEQLQKWKELRKTQSFTKALDMSSKTISPPASLQEMEKKYPSAFNQLGIKPSQLYNWGPEQCEEFITLVGEKAGAVLMAAVIHRMNMLLQKNPNDLGESAPTDQVQEPVAEAGAMPDVVEDKTPTSPENKKSLSFLGGYKRKKAA